MIRNNPISEWSLREEILRVSQRWPEFIAFCLIGSLCGLIISMLIPSPIRATRELYVGLNVYRATEDRTVAEHAGLNFNNPDDYKNWQMDNLNTMIFMDAIIDQTLENLRNQDPYWHNVDQNMLANMLHAYWRNAGKWHLVAENPDSKYARQAVLTWEDVIVNHVHTSVSESQNAMLLNNQLQSLSVVQAQSASRIIELSQTRELLSSWRTTASQEDTRLPIDEIDYGIICNLIDQVNLESSEKWLVDSFPHRSDHLLDFITWIDRIIPILNQQLLLAQTQITSLEDEKNELSARYADSASKSLGLSADLLVENLSGSKTKDAYVRPTGLLILVGGILGGITWVIYWLIKLSLKERNGQNEAV